MSLASDVLEKVRNFSSWEAYNITNWLLGSPKIVATNVVVMKPAERSSPETLQGPTRVALESAWNFEMDNEGIGELRLERMDNTETKS